MTLADYRNALKNAEFSEWWDTKTVNFDFPHIGFNKSFKGIIPAYEFASDQSKKWDQLDPSIKTMRSSLDFFHQLKEGMLSLLDHIKEGEKSIENSYRRHVGQVFQNFQHSKIFLADSPEALFLTQDAIAKDGGLFQGAHMYLSDELRGLGNIQSLQYFKGVMMAYEFATAGESLITKRKKKEQASLDQLRNSYLAYVSQSEEQLKSFLTDGQSEFSNRLKYFGENTDKQIASHQTWLNETQTKYSEFHKSTKDKIHELEETYAEKLKLEEPAIYWEERGKKMQEQAWWSLVVLIALVLISAGSLYLLLWNAPQEIYSSFISEDKSSAIRWSIVFIVFLSFVAFGIRALTKVMFSSFHLARDAQERYTLTYFYLSLLKDSSVEKEDRKLIIQSLFSRSDTGLLKEDSAPTMPSDAVTKIFK
jgi:hypothetical protein